MIIHAFCCVRSKTVSYRGEGTMAATDDRQLIERIGQGHILESPDEMTPDYRQTLIHILTVSADTELISAPSYYTAAKNSPSMNNLISALAIIQDELSHAHIGY